MASERVPGPTSGAPDRARTTPPAGRTTAAPRAAAGVDERSPRQRPTDAGGRMDDGGHERGGEEGGEQEPAAVGERRGAVQPEHERRERGEGHGPGGVDDRRRSPTDLRAQVRGG